jgi:hypothetical protein
MVADESDNGDYAAWRVVDDAGASYVEAFRRDGRVIWDYMAPKDVQAMCGLLLHLTEKSWFDTQSQRSLYRALRDGQRREVVPHG